jgi:lysophospholipase L1-like esterase
LAPGRPKPANAPSGAANAVRVEAVSLSRRRWLQGVAALVVVGCGRRKPRVQPVAPGATVLALGDSITHGSGAPAEASYPAVLAALTGWHVVNGGVPGDTSAQALARLPELMAEHTPALVIASIGGNDFLRRLPEADTRENLRRIVELARSGGAQVLLVAVPRPSMAAAAVGSLSDHAMYEEVAEAMDVPLHRDGWSRVLADEALRSDRIHANARGYRQFAEGLAATAREAGFLP